MPALLAALAAQGIQPLVNRNVHLVADDLDLWVAGVDDLGNGRPDLPLRWPVSLRMRRCSCWPITPISGCRPGPTAQT